MAAVSGSALRGGARVEEAIVSDWVVEAEPAEESGDQRGQCLGGRRGEDGAGAEVRVGTDGLDPPLFAPELTMASRAGLELCAGTMQPCAIDIAIKNHAPSTP